MQACQLGHGGGDALVKSSANGCVLNQWDNELVASQLRQPAPCRPWSGWWHMATVAFYSAPRPRLDSIGGEDAVAGGFAGRGRIGGQGVRSRRKPTPRIVAPRIVENRADTVCFLTIIKIPFFSDAQAGGWWWVKAKRRQNRDAPLWRTDSCRRNGLAGLSRSQRPAKGAGKLLAQHAQPWAGRLAEGLDEGEENRQRLDLHQKQPDGMRSSVRSQSRPGHWRKAGMGVRAGGSTSAESILPLRALMLQDDDMVR